MCPGTRRLRGGSAAGRGSASNGRRARRRPGVPDCSPSVPLREQPSCGCGRRRGRLAGPAGPLVRHSLEMEAPSTRKAVVWRGNRFLCTTAAARGSSRRGQVPGGVGSRVGRGCPERRHPQHLTGTHRGAAGGPQQGAHLLVHKVGDEVGHEVGHGIEGAGGVQEVDVPAAVQAGTGEAVQAQASGACVVGGTDVAEQGRHGRGAPRGRLHSTRLHTAACPQPHPPYESQAHGSTQAGPRPRPALTGR